jgi:hypothetical protein
MPTFGKRKNGCLLLVVNDELYFFCLLLDGKSIIAYFWFHLPTFGHDFFFLPTFGIFLAKSKEKCTEKKKKKHLFL